EGLVIWTQSVGLLEEVELSVVAQFDVHLTLSMGCLNEPVADVAQSAVPEPPTVAVAGQPIVLGNVGDVVAGSGGHSSPDWCLVGGQEVGQILAGVSLGFIGELGVDL